MSVQQTAAPSRRRGALIGVGLLLIALVAGSVTAVNLFPTRATQDAIAAVAPGWTGDLGFGRRNVLGSPIAAVAPGWTGDLGFGRRSEEPER